MLWLKKCPRCGGDLKREPDLLGGYDAVCLQCGHVAPAAFTATLPGWIDREPSRRSRRAPQSPRAA